MQVSLLLGPPGKPCLHLIKLTIIASTRIFSINLDVVVFPFVPVILRIAFLQYCLVKEKKSGINFKVISPGNEEALYFKHFCIKKVINFAIRIVEKNFVFVFNFGFTFKIFTIYIIIRNMIILKMFFIIVAIVFSTTFVFFLINQDRKVKEKIHCVKKCRKELYQNIQLFRFQNRDFEKQLKKMAESSSKRIVDFGFSLVSLFILAKFKKKK